jgi:hypothetical protein
MADYHGTSQNDVIDQDKQGIASGTNIFGGQGDDTITASSGNVIGEEGNDTITVTQSWVTAAYWNSPSGVDVNLATGVAKDGFGGTDKLVGVHSVADSSHDDKFTGSSGDDTFWLGWGADTVVGGGGTDTVNFYNYKSSDMTVSYNAATDTFTVAKHTAAGDNSTSILQGVAKIALFGTDSDGAIYTRDMFVEDHGFLRTPGVVPAAEMTNVNQMRVGDFNGDGKADILVTRTRGDVGATKVPLQILVGDGAGHFSDQTAALFKDGIPYVNYVPRIFAADFNNDGITDIFCPDFGLDTSPFPGGQNSLYLSNKAAGKLENASSTLTQALRQNHGTSVGDINHDGYLDLVVNALHEPTGHATDVLINDQTGHFVVSQQLLPPSLVNYNYDASNTWSMLGDLNGDGWDDLVLGHWQPNPNPTTVLLNDGKGSFASATPIYLPKAGLSPDETVLGIERMDLNGDNLPDLVLCVTNDGPRDVFYHTPYIQLLVNDGNGQFHDETAQRLPQSKVAQTGDMSWIFSATPIDMNGDGFQDLLVNGSNASPACVYLNDGTGHFTLGWQGAPNERVVALDLNGDGKPDLVQADSVGFSFLINSYPDVIGASHVYTAGAGGSKVQGTAAAETVYAGAGNDVVDGGGGIDTVVYTGAHSGYTVTHTDTGSTVTGASGTDTLTGVERLKFGDTALALDISGTGGQAYRLYQAAFARTPDLAGLGYWMSVMDKGAALNDIAAGFADSKEFHDAYGLNPTAAQVIDKLYQNILHRAGEPAGVAYWTSVLEGHLDRIPTVLAAFSESAENIAALTGAMQDGFAYTPFG